MGDGKRWIRLYCEVVDDPKVQTLPDHLFRMWVNILCIAGSNGGILFHETFRETWLAWKLRLTVEQIQTGISELTHYGLLETEPETSNVRPHGWDKRQYESDTSTERVRKFREKQKPVSRNVSVTPSEQIQNRTDTEQNAQVDCVLDCRSLTDALWHIHPSPARFNDIEAELANEIRKSALTPERFGNLIAENLQEWAEYWKQENRPATGLLNWVKAGDYSRHPPSRKRRTNGAPSPLPTATEMRAKEAADDVIEETQRQARRAARQAAKPEGAAQ